MDDSDVTRRSPTRRSITGALAVAQLLSWGALFYSFAIVAPELHASGWSSTAVAGAFSLGLAVNGLAAPFVARALLRRGPRITMTAGSLIGVLGMLLWAAATSTPVLWVAWAVIGVAMAATLYEPATSVLVALFGLEARKSIVALTVVGGLAATVSAPVTRALVDAHGWRTALISIGVVVGVLTGVLHVLSLPGPLAAAPATDRTDPRPPTKGAPAALLMAVAVEQFGHIISGTFLVGFLISRGHRPADAGTALAAIGVGKVAGRLLLAGRIGQIRPAALAVGATSAQAVLVVVPLFATPLAVVVVAAGGLGAAAGALSVLRAFITMQLGDRCSFPVISARLQRLAMVGRISGPLCFGVAVELLGWSAAWTLVALSFAMAALAYARIDSGAQRDPAGVDANGDRPAVSAGFEATGLPYLGRRCGCRACRTTR